VHCASTPGFIVNRVARPFYGQALRLLEERAATPAVIDRVMREVGGFRMGPCELMDLIGHDVNHAVTRSVFEAFHGDVRYRPSLVQRALVDAGWYGRKSGRGFYAYPAPAETVDDDSSGVPVATGQPDVRIEGDLGPLSALLPRLRAVTGGRMTADEGPGVIRVDGHLLALTDGRTAADRAWTLGEPVVLLDLPGDAATCTRMAWAASPDVTAGHRAAVRSLFAAMDLRDSEVADVAGLVVMRTVAMLANEAADAVGQGVATEADVDLAMQLGTNYPRGPLAWARAIGLAHVIHVLDALAANYGDGAFRVSPWLRAQWRADQLASRTPQPSRQEVLA